MTGFKFWYVLVLAFVLLARFSGYYSLRREKYEIVSRIRSKRPFSDPESESRADSTAGYLGAFAALVVGFFMTAESRSELLAESEKRITTSFGQDPIWCVFTTFLIALGIWGLVSATYLLSRHFRRRALSREIDAYFEGFAQHAAESARQRTVTPVQYEAPAPARLASGSVEDITLTSNDDCVEEIKEIFDSSRRRLAARDKARREANERKNASA